MTSILGACHIAFRVVEQITNFTEQRKFELGLHRSGALTGIESSTWQLQRPESMWDLWWTKCKWDRFYSGHSSLFLLIMILPAHHILLSTIRNRHGAGCRPHSTTESLKVTQNVLCACTYASHISSLSCFVTLCTEYVKLVMGIPLLT